MYELRSIDKKFPGVHALKGIDFKLSRGEIVGLVGENGAGKSTLMKVIYGSYQPSEGEILIDGQPVFFANPRQAMQHGIGMVFQEQSLITNLTVMENIFLGNENEFARFGVVDWKAISKQASYHLAKVKLDIDPYTITSKLSFAQRQLVEIAKVLTLEERVSGNLVILLDEPTSVLDNEGVNLLFKLVRELCNRASFIFVSHRLDEVMELSDRIYVIKDGSVVDILSKKEAKLEKIQRKMVGRDINKQYYREQKKKPYNTNELLLSCEKLTLGNHYQDISFSLHRGEVLCLVGTEGSGTEEVLRTIFGMLKPDSGSLYIEGELVTNFSPREAVLRGLAYIPRERKIEGIIGAMKLHENITLSQLGNYSHFGVLQLSQEKELAQQWLDKLAIKASSIEANCDNLSGGNQQKVVLAKWRSTGSKVILLDHPTRGLDIGAKEDVYEMVRDLCQDGKGVILVADTLEEAIGLSHNIIVMKDGQIQYKFDYASDRKPTLYDLIHYMV